MILSPDLDLKTASFLLSSYIYINESTGKPFFTYDENTRSITIANVSGFGPAGTIMSVDELRTKIVQLTSDKDGPTLRDMCDPSKICNAIDRMSS